MRDSTSIDRRTFLRFTGLTGAAFVLGLNSAKATGTSRILNLSGKSDLYLLTPYIIIEKSGKITLMNPKPEMGQGTYQSIPALIAEELEVSLDQVIIKQTSGEKEFGRQSAGGSSSVRGNYFQLRKIGASARMMLIEAASNEWQVPAVECFAENARIIHRPSGKSLGYGQLVEKASDLKVPENPVLKDAKDFKILGKSSPRPDIPLKVSGKAVFGIDAELPGMLFASVERCPVIGSKLVSYDDEETLKIKGVQKVVKTLRVLGKNRYEGVAVVAENYWAALQGRRTLKVQWDYNGFDKFNTKDYEQKLRDLSESEGIIVHNQGEFDKTFAASNLKLEAFYETPVVSHSPMEPMNCLAHWRSDGTVEIWVSSQGASLIKQELAEVLDIPQDRIIPNILFNGGAFGRRLKSDFASEAALISKSVGAPVKVIWTREDDTQLGPFRPMTFSAMKGALSPEGKAIAFQHKVISPSMSATVNALYDTSKADNSMVEGISDQQYEFPNMKNSYVFSEIHIPMAPWRAVTSTTLAFAHECFVDEMAVLAKKDPLQFRLEMMTKDSDAKRVLNGIREFSGWDKPLPSGWGRGVAQYEFFAGLAAHVVEVSKQTDNSIKVEKVYAVIDLGTVVNPDNVKAQVEGAIAMALTAATKEGIVFENGISKQTNFHNNPMLRIHEMPPVEVLILAEGGDVIKGVGEPGLPPLAPALCNAIFAATGVRIRRLPFDLKNILNSTS
jgi:isoquinoline 1-oxidoreductase subunit beta